MFLSDCRHVVALIFSDLRFEWVLSLCMVLALGAVFAPLFILLGLQEGIVGNMFDRLKSDPGSRLVTPRSPLIEPLDDAWLRLLQERASVIITSSVSYLQLSVDGLDDPVNAVPTVPQDPLMIENGISLSGADRQIVLSDRLARLTGKKSGDAFSVMPIRNTGQEERVRIEFLVAGILPRVSSEDAKIWLPVTLFEWLYRWRKGRAVPELGLTGRGDILPGEYDGALTILDRVPTDEEYRRMLAGKMSFSRRPEPVENTGWSVPQGRWVHLWRPIGSRVSESDLPSLVNRHNELGYSVEAVPYLDTFDVTLVTNGRKSRLSLTVLPGEPKLDNAESSPDGTRRVWIFQGDDIQQCTAGKISFDSGNQKKEVVVPVSVCPSGLVEQGYLAAPKDLAGKMNAARRRGAIFDSATGEFGSAEEGMHFFWAYARSIDDLEDLVEFIRSEGERSANGALSDPVSRAGEVRNIRRLAGYMEKLYLLIVVVSGVSGFFAILASVYAGVQRKRHDIAYLQMLGMHLGVLFLFPCLKSLVLVVGGIASALVAYAFFGHFSSLVFLPGGGSLTRLTGLNIVLLVSGIIVTGLVASLIAATAVTRIDPGEYIRE